MAESLVLTCMHHVTVNIYVLREEAEERPYTSIIGLCIMPHKSLLLCFPITKNAACILTRGSDRFVWGRELHKELCPAEVSVQFCP